MLALYKPRRGKSEDSNSSDSEKIIPAGVQYVTKRNGKLFLTRSKQPKRTDVAAEILGQAFGGKIKVIRKRAKSLENEPEKTPLLIGGVPYVPQLQSQHTAPLPQQGFVPPPISMPPYQQVPPQYLQYPPPFSKQHVPAYTVFNPNQGTPPAPILNTNSNPSPTKEDFDVLKRADAHFRKASIDKTQTASNAAAKDEEQPSKSTGTITKHICANCGRLRSRNYHHEHPIMPGDEPAPAFCRKCQRDASSTSESNSEREPWKPRKKRERRGKNKNKRSQQREIEDSSGSDLTVIPKNKRRPKPVLSKTSRDRIPDEDYIVVEEEFSEDDQSHRGRSHKREHDRRRHPDERRSDYNRQLSPFRERSHRSRSISHSRHENYDIPSQRQHPRRRRAHPHSRQDSTHSRQSSISFRYVKAPESTREPESVVETYPKNVPFHAVIEEDVHKFKQRSRSPTKHSGDSQPQQTYYEDVRPRYRQPSVSTDVEDENESSAAPKREYPESTPYVGTQPVAEDDSFLESVTSSHLQVAAARRRRERRAKPPASTQPWKEPHIIKLLPNDEVIVVTERYEYRRPKKVSQADEEERRRQEYLDREMLSFKNENPRLSAKEEAARYYNDDWSRDEKLAKRREEAEVLYDQDWPREEFSTETEHIPGEWPEKSGWRSERKPGSWRRDVWKDSELGWSEASYQYPVDEPENTQRAPTPPSPTFTATSYSQKSKLPYPTDSDLEIHSSNHRLWREKAMECQPSSEETVLRRPYRAPKPRSAYVREGSDEEKALVPSPQSSSSTSLILSPHVSFGRDEVQYFDDRDRSHSRSRSIDYEVEEARSDMGSVVSGMTEAETELTRRAERVIKRVTFRDDASERSGFAARAERATSERAYDSEYDSEGSSGRESKIGGGAGEWESGGGREDWENGGVDSGRGGGSGW